MTKKISLLIAAVYSVLILSACTAIDFGKIGVGENDPATEGEKVVATFHNHIRSNALEDFDKYFVADSDPSAQYAKFTDIDALKDDLYNRLGDISKYISEETADEWLAKFVAKYYGASDYTIDDVTVDGEDVNVTVTMKVPDFSQTTEISREDINLILEESFAFDINDTDLFFSELALRKGKDEAELRDIYSNSDASVWIADILELFSDEFDTVFGLVTDKLFADCPVKDYTIRYTVEKQADDAWKITDVNND